MARPRGAPVRSLIICGSASKNKPLAATPAPGPRTEHEIVGNGSPSPSEQRCFLQHKSAPSQHRGRSSHKLPLCCAGEGAVGLGTPASCRLWCVPGSVTQASGDKECTPVEVQTVCGLRLDLGHVERQYSFVGSAGWFSAKRGRGAW